MYAAQRSKINAKVVEYSARYTQQPIRDGEWPSPGATPTKSQRRPNYRPTPLRWYFILAQIFFLLVLMALVMWARQGMPDSDSTATIEHKRWLYGRQVSEAAAAPVQTLAAQEPTQVIAITTDAAPQESGAGSQDAPAPSAKEESLPTETATPKTSEQETSKSTTEEIETKHSSSAADAKSSSSQDESESKPTDEADASKMATLGGLDINDPTSSSDIRDDATTTGKDGDIMTTTFVSQSFRMKIVPAATSEFISTVQVTSEEEFTSLVTLAEAFSGSDAVTVIPTTSTKQMVVTEPGKVVTMTSIGTHPFTSRLNLTTGGGTFTSVYETTLPGSEETIITAIEGSATVPITVAPPIVSTSIGTSTFVTAVPTVIQTTRDRSTYIDVGEVTITSVYTLGGRGDPSREKATAVKPRVIDVVSVENGKNVKVVQTQAPVTVVTYVDDVQTVVQTQQPVTRVMEVKGATTTLAFAIMGLDGIPTTSMVVSTLPDSLSTEVDSPLTTTFLSTSRKKTTIVSTPDDLTYMSALAPVTKTYKSTLTGTGTGIGPTPEPTDETVSKTTVYKITEGEYFAGKFLPTILSVILSFPLHIIDLNAQQFQPFYALNRPHGALGGSSMTLHYSGWAGFIKPFSTLAEGHPIPFLTMIIVWASSIMTPLASEAIGVKIHGRCKLTVAEGCAAALGVSPLPTRALVALMAFTCVLLFVLMFYLRRWETGLYANPWNIVGIASLATNREIRPRAQTEKKIEVEMAEKRYGFGYFRTRYGETEYGIVLYDDAGQALHRRSSSSSSSDAASASSPTGVYEVEPLVTNGKKKRSMPFIALTWWWRILFIAFMLGLAGFLLYYHVTPIKDDSFTKFMNGQTFGIRFLFSSAGVILVFGWTAAFISKPALLN